jgi:hypothetical protein
MCVCVWGGGGLASPSGSMMGSNAGPADAPVPFLSAAGLSPGPKKSVLARFLACEQSGCEQGNDIS